MLTKPGIILGNIITTLGGFALASRGQIDFVLLLYTLLGLGLIIASAGVFNSYIDRFADAKMERTKNRPLVRGEISNQKALLFGTFLGLVGVFVLALKTNPLTVFVALSGFSIYLILYAFMKYHSFYGTLVGSLAGAVPPVVGYCAVSNTFDAGAVLIFLMLVLWQMPHFYAIAIYRQEDYAAASIPVLPIVKGMEATKIQIVFYVVLFIIASVLFTPMGMMGSLYGIAAALLGMAWLALSIWGFFIPKGKDKRWAFQMFSFSLVVILGLCLIIPFDVVKGVTS